MCDDRSPSSRSYCGHGYGDNHGTAGRCADHARDDVRLAHAADRVAHRSDPGEGLRGMSNTVDKPHADASVPDTAAAPSPFTPIANYGFLSNCHTGALVAPDGTVDWLCVPRFDSPSVFGALLDRGAGGFRFAPFGINVPSDRIYEPGTNTLVTSWKTPTGWVVVRDGARDGTAPWRGHGYPAHETAIRRGRRSRARADRQMHRRQCGDRSRVRARVRLWARSRRVDAEPR